MISDASQLEEGATLQADICIIGAGAAGITLARDLLGAGFRVLVIESGGFEAESATQALYRGAMTGINTWELDAVRARVFGGSTALWAGFCRPLSRDDFEAKSYVPGSGWPIRYDDLVPYYKRACVTVEVGGFQYDVDALSAQAGLPLLPFDPNVIESRIFHFSPPTRFGARYRGDLESATDIQVYLHANLFAVRLASSDNSVSHLECKTLPELGGISFTVESSRYVLALGGIENARLLLASNAERPEGVANGSGLVGQFMEHPHYYGFLALLCRDVPDLRFYSPFTANVPYDDGSDATVPLMGVLALSAGVRAAGALPNFTAEIGAVPITNPTGTIGASTIAPLFGRDVGGPQLLHVNCRCEQFVTPDSRITLNQDVDALGMPRIDLRWSILPENQMAMLRACEIMGRELGRLGFGRLWVPPQGTDVWTRPNGGSHHLGTTRMSADPAEGVVDANLRAHDIDNLYILGSSVFASGGDANPTLTIVALAHRLADHLKAV